MNDFSFHIGRPEFGRDGSSLCERDRRVILRLAQREAGRVDPIASSDNGARQGSGLLARIRPGRLALASILTLWAAVNVLATAKTGLSTAPFELANLIASLAASIQAIGFAVGRSRSVRPGSRPRGQGERLDARRSLA